jgi:hypothetical protein
MSSPISLTINWNATKHGQGRPGQGLSLFKLSLFKLQRFKKSMAATRRQTRGRARAFQIDCSLLLNPNDAAEDGFAPG